MRVRPVDSVSQFIDLIVKDREIDFTEVVYRGHADASWRTVPSLFRSDTFAKYEHEMGRDLIAHFPQDFQNDSAMFDRLVRMQHYGLPTRLVDVTVNPLVALYFACQSVTEQGSEKDAHVVAYRVKATRTKYYDSDTVSILANLSSLDSDDKRELMTEADKYMEYKQQAFKESFNVSSPVERLLHFIRHEKPHFKGIIDPADLYRPLYVRPRLSNRRIIAQAGAFLIYGFPVDRSRKLFVPDIEQRFYRIPGVGKRQFIDDLARLGITGSMLFPELDKAADYIKERYGKRWGWGLFDSIKKFSPLAPQ